MNSITSVFSQYVDYFLQPFVSNLLSYIKNGIDLLELQYQWEPNYSWLSLEIQSLYTYIPHNVGKQSIQNFLMDDSSIHPNQVQFTITFYSNIITTPKPMALHEAQHIWANNPFMPRIIFYSCYIDDIIIWDGYTNHIEQVVSHCNNNMGLSFTSVHNTHLAFQDLNLYHENDMSRTTINLPQATPSYTTTDVTTRAG